MHRTTQVTPHRAAMATHLRRLSASCNSSKSLRQRLNMVRHQRIPSTRATASINTPELSMVNSSEDAGAGLWGFERPAQALVLQGSGPGALRREHLPPPPLVGPRLDRRAGD